MRDAKSTLLRDEFSYLDLKAIIPEAIHSQMMKYFRQYIAIGGMPEAVQKYIDTRDFRAYTTDLSLLMAMKDFSIKQHIIENTLIGNSKGGIFECAVADALYKKGYPLYFYKNETTKKEIDIIIQKDGKVIPIEVKSGNTRANSLKSIMKNNKDISFGYKFIDGNIGASKEGIITLPLYMVAFFDI